MRNRIDVESASRVARRAGTGSRRAPRSSTPAAGQRNSNLARASCRAASSAPYPTGMSRFPGGLRGNQQGRLSLRDIPGRWGESDDRTESRLDGGVDLGRAARRGARERRRGSRGGVAGARPAPLRARWRAAARLSAGARPGAPRRASSRCSRSGKRATSRAPRWRCADRWRQARARGHREEPTASPPNATTPGSCAPSTSTRGPGRVVLASSTSEWRARRAPRRSLPRSPCSSAGARARRSDANGSGTGGRAAAGPAGARGPAKAAGGSPRAPLVSGASAIHGEMPDTSGAAFGVFGVSHSAQGAGLVGRNETAGADLVLDGAAQGEADTLFTQAGIDRPSGSPQTFDVQNSDAGAMTLRVDGVAVDTATTAIDWTRLASVPPGFADGIDDDSGGDITGVSAGSGLSGGGSSGAVTLAASFGGSGAAATVSRSDHNHFGQTWIGKYSGRPVRAEPAQRRPRAQWPRDGDRWREHWRRGQEQLDQWPSALRPRHCEQRRRPWRLGTIHLVGRRGRQRRGLRDHRYQLGRLRQGRLDGRPGRRRGDHVDHRHHLRSPGIERFDGRARRLRLRPSPRPGWTTSPATSPSPARSRRAAARSRSTTRSTPRTSTSTTPSSSRPT